MQLSVIWWCVVFLISGRILQQPEVLVSTHTFHKFPYFRSGFCYLVLFIDFWVGFGLRPYCQYSSLMLGKHSDCFDLFGGGRSILSIAVFMITNLYEASWKWVWVTCAVHHNACNVCIWIWSAGYMWLLLMMLSWFGFDWTRPVQTRQLLQKIDHSPEACTLFDSSRHSSVCVISTMLWPQSSDPVVASIRVWAHATIHLHHSTQLLEFKTRTYWLKLDGQQQSCCWLIPLCL